MKKNIAILGSTGSIGRQALEVCENLGIKPVALTAHQNNALLEEQVRRLRPRYVAVSDETTYTDLKVRLADLDVKILAGLQGICELAALGEVELVLNAVVGMVGLRPTLAAIDAKKEIALANKETLVAAGDLVMRRAAEQGVHILPVDSEHSAIFQCLQASGKHRPQRLLLTASGGPFFGKTKAELAGVTVQQALKHPNWSMGAKITVDSATLMNKGLELIEACHLFGVAPDVVEILVHRQSIVHSLVEFEDNSVLAQLGTADMRIPIQYALTFPERKPSLARRLSLVECGSLTFSKPDIDSFDCLRACLQAAQLGGLYPCLANAVNEQAVALFLREELSFLQIGEWVLEAVQTLSAKKDYTLEDVFETQQRAEEFIAKKRKTIY